jgi:hypothetical protein
VLPAYALKILSNLETAYGANKYTYFLGIVYGLALESGFTPHIPTMKMREIGVKASDVPCFARYHAQLCRKFANCAVDVVEPVTDQFYQIALSIFPFSTELFRLVAIKSDDSLCLTLTGENVAIGGLSLYLPVSRFVPLVKRDNKPACFRNLKELSIKLKNLIFTPMRDSTLITFNCFVPALQCVPVEIFEKFLGGLTKAELVQLSLTNWKIREWCMEFWKHKLRSR